MHHQGHAQGRPLPRVHPLRGGRRAAGGLHAPPRLRPTIPLAYDFVDPERAKILPTYEENFKSGVAVDEEYWGEHKDQVIERFNAWLLG